MQQRLRHLDARRIWDLALIAAFVPGAAYWAFIVLIYPIGLGSHANIYTEAALDRMGRAVGEPPSTAPYPRIEDGAHTMAFTEACLASQQRGGWVDVAKVPG